MFLRLLSRLKIKRNRPPSGSKAHEIFQKKYSYFRSILESNSELLKIISDFEKKQSENSFFSMAYIRTQTTRVTFYTERMINSFEKLSGRPYPLFHTTLKRIIDLFAAQRDNKTVPATTEHVVPYTSINKEMVAAVGGKNANLGEVKALGLPVPRGFAITTTAFQ